MEDPRKRPYLGCWLLPLIPRACDFLSWFLDFCGFLVFCLSVDTEPPNFCPRRGATCIPHFTASHPISDTCSPPTPSPVGHVGAGIWHISTLEQLGCPLPKKVRPNQN